jgi:hypothetical protein
MMMRQGQQWKRTDTRFQNLPVYETERAADVQSHGKETGEGSMQIRGKHGQCGGKWHARRDDATARGARLQAAEDKVTRVASNQGSGVNNQVT